MALLERLAPEGQGLRGAAPPPSSNEHGPVGALGRWAVLQGREARGVLGFFGRIATVIGRDPFTSAGAAHVVDGTAYL